MGVAQWRSMGRSSKGIQNVPTCIYVSISCIMRASAYTQCKLPYAMLCYCNVVQGKECGVVYCMG